MVLLSGVRYVWSARASIPFLGVWRRDVGAGGAGSCELVQVKGQAMMDNMLVNTDAPARPHAARAPCRGRRLPRRYAQNRPRGETECSY